MKAERKVFGRLQNVYAPPDLIEIQTKAYNDFLQEDVPPAKRAEKGLQAIFHEIFPIESYDGRYVLDFVKYEITPPKVSWVDSLKEGESYTASLHVTFRLKSESEVREETVFMGEVPLITEQGTFIVNGAERVIVSQLHRSPGICFESSVHANGTLLHSFRIIPDRGAWVEVQFDTSDLLNVYLDRKKRRRKFLASTFLRALGYGTDEELLGLFYTFEEINVSRPRPEQLENRVVKADVKDADSETVLVKRFEPVTADLLKQLKAAGISTLAAVNVEWDGGLFLKSVRKDPTASMDDALKDLYRKLRPGDPSSASSSIPAATTSAASAATRSSRSSAPSSRPSAAPPTTRRARWRRRTSSPPSATSSACATAKARWTTSTTSAAAASAPSANSSRTSAASASAAPSGWSARR